MSDHLKTSADEEVARHWNGNANLWARELSSGQDRYREVFLEPSFMQFLGDIHGLKLLDAACGEGTSSRLMARHGARVTGLDLSSAMIQHALGEERRAPLGIGYGEGSICKLTQFADEEFDAVASWMALMDVSCYREAVREFYRVLRPGGRFCFNITHPCFFTPGMGISRDSGRGRPMLTISNYFLSKPRTESWSFSGSSLEKGGVKAFSVLRFQRTLSDYLNSLSDAGFVIERVEEPRPDEAMCRHLPRLKFWEEHAALYLFVCAKKP